MEIELRRQGVALRKDDNAFLSVSDPEALHAADDKLSASTIEKRLNYWTWPLGPKFSGKDRTTINLKRGYSINQIEYCRNFVFKRHFPIHKIFEHSCEMGLFSMSTDKVAHIFGVRITKRLHGKLHSVLEKLDHGRHVMRIYCNHPVGRIYEKSCRPACSIGPSIASARARSSDQVASVVGSGCAMNMSQERNCAGART